MRAAAMSLVSTAFPVPLIPAMPFAGDDWPQAGTSAHRPAVSTSAVTPASRIIRVFCIFIPLGPFLDPIDVVGDKTVRLPVNVGRGLRRRRLDQAEHPPGALVDPVPEVPDVIRRLRLQIGEVSLGDVVHRNAAVELVEIHEKRHWRPPFQSSEISPRP